MRTEIQKAFKINEMVITTRSGLLSLTDLWKAIGRPKFKEPKEWIRTEPAQEFIDSQVEKSEVGIPTSVLQVFAGKGTYGSRNVFLAYAEWLSPDIHHEVLEGYQRWVEEEKNPALKIERGVQKYLDRGCDPVWVAERLEGIAVRKDLTHTMSDHNCRQIGNYNPYKEATRSITLSVLGKTPREIRDERNTKITRDSLDQYELVRIKFAESEAKKKIVGEGADGNEECVSACRLAGRAVKAAIAMMSGDFRTNVS